MSNLEYSMERYDKNIVRILRGAQIVGFFMRCRDERWSIVDNNDHTASKRRFLRPKDALAFINGGGLTAPLDAQGPRRPGMTTNQPSEPLLPSLEILVGQARFLLERLEGFDDWSMEQDEMLRNWSGHVDPARSRLETTVARFEAALKEAAPATREALEEGERGVAQFFFEIGYGACFAEAYIRNGNRVLWPLSDAEVERAWEIAGEAHDDPEEFDRYLAHASTTQPAQPAVREADQPFARGDKVRKIAGLPFGDGDATVLCCYQMTNGAWRVVAEHPEGWQHIFAPEQLILAALSTDPTS